MRPTGRTPRARERAAPIRSGDMGEASGRAAARPAGEPRRKSAARRGRAASRAGRRGWRRARAPPPRQIRPGPVPPELSARRGRALFPSMRPGRAFRGRAVRSARRPVSRGETRRSPEREAPPVPPRGTCRPRRRKAPRRRGRRGRAAARNRRGCRRTAQTRRRRPKGAAGGRARRAAQRSRRPPA